MSRRPTAVAMGDAHIANARWADDSRGKHGYLSSLFRWVIEKEVLLITLGDLCEQLGVGIGNEAQIFEPIPNRFTFEWLERALSYGQADNVPDAGGAGVSGNHDWWLSWDTMTRLRLQRGSVVLRFGDEIVWIEHGHALEKPVTARTVHLARFAYWFETNWWVGADEAALKVWRWWKNRERGGRNERAGDEQEPIDAGRIPYWWLAVQRKLEHPEITTVLHGHSHDGGVEVLATDAGPVWHVDADSWTTNPRGENRMSVAVLDLDSPERWRVLQVEELMAEYS